MIVYTRYSTDGSTNILAGTDLATAPGDGILKVYAASTQSDTLLTVTAPPRIAARNIPCVVKTAAVNQLDQDVPIILPVLRGESLVVQITEVTAATMAQTVIFIPREEL